MATPLDALAFREMFGRQLRRPERGRIQAYQVAPFSNDMTRTEINTMIERVRISLIRCIDHGDVHYVSHEMTEAIKDIMARQLQDRTVFHVDQGDLPSLTGFVYFDGPIPIPTVYSKTGYQNLRAILWDQYAIATSNVDGKTMAYHGGAEDAANVSPPEVVGKIIYTVCDTPNEQRRAEYGPWMTRHWIPAPWGVRFNPRGMDDHMHDDSRFRDTGLTEEEWEQDKIDTVEAFETLFKTLTVWTRVIQTEIPVHHPRPSSYDKVMHKEGRPPADVKVTLLRRYSDTPPHGLAEVDWAYRWEVKGHYRWQRVGPGRTLLQRVWVKEHVKGPPDKPLVRRPAVTALVR